MYKLLCFTGESDVETPSVNGLCFVKSDDCDAILVATNPTSGGKVELWELREMQHSMHKIFASGSDVPTPRITCKIWTHVGMFTGPSAQVVSMATPRSTLQSGAGSPCYVTVGYSDGSIQCLLKDSLLQIASVDLPKNGKNVEIPSLKLLL